MNMISTHRTQIIGLTVVLFAIYGQSLGFGFQFDDGHSISQNPHIRSFGNVPTFFLDPSLFSADASLVMYRPVVLTSYAVNHAISQLAPWSYHLVNMVVHLCVAVLVGLLARQLAKSNLVAWMAAWLFALHPVHSEAVYYISSRSESLAALAVLASFLLYVVRGDRLWRGIGSVLCFAAGLGAKSSAIVLLPILLLYELLIRKPSAPDRRGRWNWYAVMVGVGLLYVLQTRAIISKATIAAPVRSYAEQWWTQVKALTYYVHLLIVPRELSVDHQFLISDTISDPFAVAALLFGVSLLFLVGQSALSGSRGEAKWPLFLVLWFLAALAPASLVPLNVIVNEHRLYLAGVAFALGLALLVRTDLRARRGLLLALPLLAVTASNRGDAWASVESLWTDAAHKGPGMARPFIMLGFEYQQQGNHAAAIGALNEALARDSTFVPGYVALGEAYLNLGRVEQARQVAVRGTQVQPDSVNVWVQLAQAEREVALSMGESPTREQAAFERSASAYRQALMLAPNDADLHDNLGTTFQYLGRAQEALAHHERAVELMPERAVTRLGYGNVLFMLKDFAAAAQQYRHALRIDPDHVLAWDNLASALEQMGQKIEASAARHEASRRREGFGR